MFNKQYIPYATGRKIYGGGRSFPNIGASDKSGYRERDLKHRARRNAMLRRLKANRKKEYMSEDWLRGS